MNNNIVLLIYIISFAIYIYYKDNLPQIVKSIYKNPIFKIVFLLSLYYYGNTNIPITLLLAIYYVSLGQVIQEKELLHNI
uniref:Uncharacterized protein n=1 Tax=viral metagenome TaxID=1070528 RepID=A0A6C0DBT4_9ZZZZ